MTAVWLWARRDIRRRWRSVIVLALLTAIAGGVAMTAITGARRSAVVVAETMEERRQPDVISFNTIPDFDWGPIVNLPYVEDYSVFAATPLCTRETGGLGETFGSVERAVCAQPPIEGGAYETVARMDMLEGRMPIGPDEAAINRLAQVDHGFDVGDRLTFEGVWPGRLQDYWNGEPRGGRPWGPTYSTRVTGVFTGSDDFWRLMSGGNGGPGVALSRSFFPTHGDSLGFLPQAYLRLERGEADIPRLVEDIARITGDPAFPLRNVHDARRLVERGTGFEGTALLLFAIALILAASVLVGQALVRMVAAGGTAAGALRSIGMGPRELVTSLAAPALLVGVTGGIGAVLVSLATTPRVPLGLARTFELDRGLKVDPPVLALGALAIALAVAIAALTTAALTARGSQSRSVTSSARSAGAIARLRLPPPLLLGVRMAFERRSSAASPLRPALVGAAVSVTAVVAALTVAHGLAETVERPSRAGQVWDAAYYGETDGRAIAADPDVIGAERISRAVVSVGGLPTAAYGVRPLGDPLGHVVIEGRPPRRADEVALGPSTASALGVGVGETIPAGPQGERPVEVVGTALLWEDAGAAAYDEGAWTTAAGLGRLAPAQIDRRSYFVDVRPGADLAALDRRMEAAGVRRDEYWPNQTPAGLDNLETTRDLPLLLGVLLAILGAGAVGHGVLVTARRRRRDLAILRSLGLSARQAWATLAWQATTVAAVALVVGVPVGIAAGHLLWWLIASSVPVVYVAPGLVGAVALVIPAALLIANAAALGPGRKAARTPPATVLRAE